MGKEIAIQELSELVDELVRNPKSLLGTMELKGFLGELPYGTIPNEVLDELQDKLGKVNPRAAMLLLDYSVGQVVSMQ